MKKGIAVAGSLVADIVYTVDRYPEIGALTKIQDPIINNTGGAVCNTAMVLAKLDSQLPITALGKVGKDEAAERIWEAFRRYPNIDVSQIGAEGSTSFTLVIVDSASKQRSFFAIGALTRFSARMISTGINLTRRFSISAISYP